MKNQKNFLKEQIDEIWKRVLGGFVIFLVIMPIGVALWRLDNIISMKLLGVTCLRIFSVSFFYFFWLIIQTLFIPYNSKILEYKEDPVKKEVVKMYDFAFGVLYLFAAAIIGISIIFEYSTIILLVVMSTLIMVEVVRRSQQKKYQQVLL